MTDVTSIVKLYVDEEILPEFTEKLSRELRDNVKSIISPGNPGYDTGHLHDSINNEYSVNGGVGTASAYYTADYGQYVDQGHSHKTRNGSWSFQGVHFLDRGLEKTIALYE